MAERRLTRQKKTGFELRGEIIELNKITLRGRFRCKDGREFSFDASSCDNPQRLIADFAKKETIFIADTDPHFQLPATL